MLNETQKIEKGVMARNPIITDRMKRYLGRVFSSMMAGGFGAAVVVWTAVIVI